MTGDGSASMCESDGAYVLGALSAAERREYEVHLAGCDRCQRSIAGLSSVPLALRDLPADDAVKLLDDPESVDLPDLGRLVGSDRVVTPLPRARRRPARSLVAAAACGAVLGGLAVGFGGRLGGSGDATEVASRSTTSSTATSTAAPGSAGNATSELDVQPVRMDRMAATSMNADVTITPRSWGCELRLDADYDDSATDVGMRAEYVLLVVGRDGTEHSVAEWNGKVGVTAAPVATTHLALEEIAAVQVRMMLTNQLLLEAHPTLS